MTGLFEFVSELVDIPSVSHNEAAIADFVEGVLRPLPYLEVARIGDNVLARTAFGRPMRLMLAGHLDTVPPNNNSRAVVAGDVLHGLGSADMKGGLAVMIELLRRLGDEEPAVDVTFIAYVCEEVEQRYSGLFQIEAAAPEWLDADAAILGEPTASMVEAGCQGVLKIDVTLTGERAHTARPWMGVNAIHRLGEVLQLVASYEGRRPVIDGCEFREALQAVSVAGGVANNVVPDEVSVVLNHRYAPDRSVEEAYSSVCSLIAPALSDSRGDRVELGGSSLPAAPGLGHSLLARLLSLSGGEPSAKLGWTDVSFFSARGVPAVNFGPGEPTLAHSAGECVTRADVQQAYGVLAELVRVGPKPS